MKRVVLATAVASALLAGPDIGKIIDYDTQDDQIAQTQEAQEVSKPIPVLAPVVTKPPLVKVQQKKVSCCSNRDSIDLIGGYNFTEDSSVLDGAATMGIRYNKNIAPNTYVQVGYDRVFNGDYKHKHKRGRSVSGDGAGGNSNSSGTNYSGKNGDSTSGNGIYDGAYSSNQHNKNTSLDRFYLNGLYEFCQDDSRLIPYLFGGLGYEHVKHEAYGLKSGGFVDAGGGLKYQLNDDINLLSEARAIKKFKNHDLDIVTSLGVGFMFGNSHYQTDLSEDELNDENITNNALLKEDSVQTIAAIPDAPYHEEMDDSQNYDNYDSVPIDVEDSQQATMQDNKKDNSIQNSNSGKYYIQIAALFSSKSGDRKYYKKLEDNGLNHIIKKITLRGRPVKLLLAGPYTNKSDAQADLKFARKVSKGAFVKKI